MATPLTGRTIIDNFKSIIDDEVDDDFALFLANTAKDEVESGRDWNFNRGFDNSKSIASGDTYLTTKALPTDFSHPRKLFAAGDVSPYNLVAYEDRERFKDVYKRWYIDYLNQTFSICGSQGITATLNLYYGRSTDDITLTTSPKWPAQFHKYLPFKMAEMYQSGIDGDEVNFRMSPANARMANLLFKAFVSWDARIKTFEYNAKNARGVDYGSQPNVVGEEYIP